MAEGYFPGSSRPLAPPPGLPSEVRIPEDLGVEFLVKGAKVRLFTIGEAASLLNRGPATLRKWEFKSIIPKATFVKPGRGGDSRGRRRLYSLDQVSALIRIAAEEGILHNPTAKISATKFTPKVFEAFRRLQ